MLRVGPIFPPRPVFSGYFPHQALPLSLSDGSATERCGHYRFFGRRKTPLASQARMFPNNRTPPWAAFFSRNRQVRSAYKGPRAVKQRPGEMPGEKSEPKSPWEILRRCDPMTWFIARHVVAGAVPGMPSGTTPHRPCPYRHYSVRRFKSNRIMPENLPTQSARL